MPKIQNESYSQLPIALLGAAIGCFQYAKDTK